jgi:hypothetical protein
MGVHLSVQKVPVCWAFSPLFNYERLYSDTHSTVVEPFHIFGINNLTIGRYRVHDLIIPQSENSRTE